VPGVRATDVIRSLLTPGEFVMNRAAVARAGVGTDTVSSAMSRTFREHLPELGIPPQ